VKGNKVSNISPKMTDFKSPVGWRDGLPARQLRVGGSNIRKNVPLWDGLGGDAAGENSNLPFSGIGVECAKCMAFNRRYSDINRALHL
jgi:hypothetical protein